jgi:hypothetical protein
MDDEEILHVGIGVGHIGLDPGDVGVGRPHPQPVDQRLDRRGRALRPHLDPPVRQVPDPAVEVETPGGLPAALAEVDALDQTADECMNRCLAHAPTLDPPPLDPAMAAGIHTGHRHRLAAQIRASRVRCHPLACRQLTLV